MVANRSCGRRKIHSRVAAQLPKLAGAGGWGCKKTGRFRGIPERHKQFNGKTITYGNLPSTEFYFESVDDPQEKTRLYKNQRLTKMRFHGIGWKFHGIPWSLFFQEFRFCGLDTPNFSTSFLLFLFVF